MTALALLAFELTVPLGLDMYLPAPSQNRPDADTAAIGRRLFFEKRLSRDGSMSCGTCHDPKRAYTDDKPVAVGVAGIKGTRRTPSILNRAYGRAFFWDGRVATLEEQVLMPIENPKEMDLKIDLAEARVGMDRATMARALATYVRTILAGDSLRPVRGRRQRRVDGRGAAGPAVVSGQGELRIMPCGSEPDR
ncbi:MAG: cytochrome-c peroxidase [Bryobacteraceae bacterium]